MGMAKFTLVLCTIGLALTGTAQNRVTCTTMLNQITCYQPPDYVSPIIDAMKSPPISN
jgi:hypothetical protein